MIGDFIHFYKGSLVSLERVELTSYFQLPTFDEFVRLERLNEHERFERLDGNAAFSSNSGLELLDDLDVSSGLNGLHGLFARTIGCLRAVSQLL